MLFLTTFEDITKPFESFISKFIPESIIPVLIQLCATLVIFIVVAKFVFKPVREILRKRQEYVANQIHDAEVSKTNSLKYESEAKASISEAKEKSNQIIANAKKEAEELKEKAMLELDEELKQNRLRAQEEINQEKKAAIEDVRKQIVDVALLASETILNREINKDDNQRLVEDFVKDVVN